MVHFHPVLVAALALWAMSEAAIFAGDLRKGAGRPVDRSSRLLIFVMVAVGFMLANVAARRHAAPLPGSAVHWQMAGAALVVAGVALRQWAVRTLGAFFRTRVTILDDHELVTDGPYARVRHPSYAGGLISMTGVAIAYCDAASLAAILLATIVAFAYRIRVEESALASRFGADYAAYRSRTGAFLPRLG